LKPQCCQNNNKTQKPSQLVVARTCNPRYSGGRDQEDCGLKPAWANSSSRSYLEKTHQKKGLVELVEVKALSSNPSTAKKRKTSI
jgi:hypothetical protein